MKRTKCRVARMEAVERSDAEVAAGLGLPVKRAALEKLVIGRREWLSLPGLGIDCISAKVDSGAYTSSLHAEEVETFEKDGVEWVRFLTHNHHGVAVRCEAPVRMQKRVKSSTGKARTRIFIQAVVRTAGGMEWELRLSLADRSVMKCPMLLGRLALSGRFLIESQRSHLFGTLEELTGHKARRKKG